MEFKLTIHRHDASERQTLTAAGIRELCRDAIVADVSTLQPKRCGTGVPLKELLCRSVVDAAHGFVTLHSNDGFAASLPIEIARHGFLVFELNGEPLPERLGGPFRFFLVDSVECGTAEADHCANVKQIVRIEWSAERGPDTRG